MIIYEVNLTVEQIIWPEFLEWLKEHQKQMLTLEGFRGFKNYLLEPQENSNSVQLTVHYEIESLTRLESYFQFRASEMRSRATQLFGTKFTASRRILIQQNNV